jgi:AraC family transcriptional regulator
MAFPRGPSRQYSNPFSEFRGETLCNADFGGLGFHASRFQTDAFIETHKHTDAYVCFLVSGVLNERTGRHYSKHFPLSLIIHPAGEEHEDSFEGNGLCVDLKIASSWIANCDRTRLLSERIAFDRGPMVHLGLRLLHLYNRRRLDLAMLELEEIAAEIVSLDSCMEAIRTTPTLSRVLELIEADRGGSVRLSDYARISGLHPVYLARAFRKAYGMSIGEYHRHVRLRDSVNMLASSDVPICQVATECGFYDQSHFTHILRRSTGFTPNGLRRVGREGLAQVRRIQDRKLRRK